MHDADARSLRRATLILLVVSSARCGWSFTPRESAFGGSDVLPELAPAAREAAEQGRVRSRPLGLNEQIDPNRASEEELDRLPGIGPAGAAAIVAARDSGIVFRRSGDLMAVRGIGPVLLEKIRLSLDLTSPPPGPSVPIHRVGSIPTRIDLNRADAEALQELPGVGPTLAGRIISARRERPFQSVDDLVRVPGIGPASIARLRGLVVVGRGR